MIPLRALWSRYWRTLFCAMLDDQTTGNEQKETAKKEKWPDGWAMTKEWKRAKHTQQKPCPFLSLQSEHEWHTPLESRNSREISTVRPRLWLYSFLISCLSSSPPIPPLNFICQARSSLLTSNGRSSLFFARSCLTSHPHTPSRKIVAKCFNAIYLHVMSLKKHKQTFYCREFIKEKDTLTFASPSYCHSMEPAPYSIFHHQQSRPKKQ